MSLGILPTCWHLHCKHLQLSAWSEGFHLVSYFWALSKRMPVGKHKLEMCPFLILTNSRYTVSSYSTTTFCFFKGYVAPQNYQTIKQPNVCWKIKPFAFAGVWVGLKCMYLGYVFICLVFNFREMIETLGTVQRVRNSKRYVQMFGELLTQFWFYDYVVFSNH